MKGDDDGHHRLGAARVMRMTSIPTDIKYIVRTPGFYGGKPCIGDHKIAVHDIAVRHNEGYTPEQIATDLFPVLTLAQVYAALLYDVEH